MRHFFFPGSESPLIVTGRKGNAPSDLKVTIDLVQFSFPISGVVVLGAQAEDKALLLALVTKDLLGRYHAGELIKALAPMVGGGGGGRPDLAQAGGKDASKLDEALATVAGWVERTARA